MHYQEIWYLNQEEEAMNYPGCGEMAGFTGMGAWVSQAADCPTSE